MDDRARQKQSQFHKGKDPATFFPMNKVHAQQKLIPTPSSYTLSNLPK